MIVESAIAGRFARPKETWYLVGTDHGKEQRAASTLQDQEIAVYLPLDLEGPLFPGYLFVRIEQRDVEIIRQSYIMHLIHFGEAPAVVPHEIIETLRATEWVRGESCKEESRVRLNDLAGPYSNMEAIVKAKKGDRIIVLLNIMGNQAEKILPTKAVEAA